MDVTRAFSSCTSIRTLSSGGWKTADVEQSDGSRELAALPLPADIVGLLEGIQTTRAIRRYADEPVPVDVLRTILFLSLIHI